MNRPAANDGARASRLNHPNAPLAQRSRLSHFSTPPGAAQDAQHGGQDAHPTPHPFIR